MDPLTAMAIASIPSLIQGGTGIAQMIKGNQMGKNLQDPRMPIPKSAMEALQNARVMASSYNMPGYENYVQNMNQIMSGAVGQINRSATDSQSALGALLGASGQQMQSANDIAKANAQQYAENQANLRNQLGQMSALEQAKWENDVLQPFMRKAQAAQGMAGAGMQNTFAGLSNLAGVAASGYKMGAFGTGEGATATPGVTAGEGINPNALSMTAAANPMYTPISGYSQYGQSQFSPLISAILSSNSSQ